MELFCALGLITLCIIAFAHEKCPEGPLFQSKALNKATPVVICFIIAFVFSITLDLCPFNSELPKTDSSVFLYIGKAMFNGSVPYKDLFDHKGILLYFIQFLGFVIGFGSQIGVFVLEVLNILATALIFYKICKIFTANEFVCFFSVAAVLLFCTTGFFEGGNLVEEYALVWISLSLYFVCKFFSDKTYENWHIVIIGVCFAVVFFLRVNMVGVWGGLLLPVVICFLKNKRFTELYKAALWFLVGFAAVSVPVMIYLFITGSFREMIDCYLVFNFSYVDSTSKSGVITFLFDCIALTPIATFFVIYSITAHAKNQLTHINLISLIFAYLSSAISGRSYPHYGIILIPFFVIPTVLCVSDFLKKAKNIKFAALKNSILIFICVLCLSFAISDKENKRDNLASNESKEPDEVVEYILQNSGEDDDVLVIGNDVAYYFKFNRSTKNKFFYQTPPIEVSTEIYNEFIEEMDKHPSDFIVVPKPDYSKEDEPSNQTIIANKFYYEYEVLGIYRLKELDNHFIYVRKEG